MNGYDKLSRHFANRNERLLRSLLIRDYGARNYRLTRDGDVHVYGTMPNTNQEGWYLLSSRDHAMREYNIV